MHALTKLCVHIVNVRIYNISSGCPENCFSHKRTLKDFKNAKIENSLYLLTFDFSILLRFGKNKHQYVSNTCFKFYVKIINNVRATVYQIAIPYDSNVAI